MGLCCPVGTVKCFIWAFNPRPSSSGVKKCPCDCHGYSAVIGCRDTKRGWNSSWWQSLKRSWISSPLCLFSGNIKLRLKVLRTWKVKTKSWHDNVIHGEKYFSFNCIIRCKVNQDRTKAEPCFRCKISSLTSIFSNQWNFFTEGLKIYGGMSYYCILRRLCFI